MDEPVKDYPIVKGLEDPVKVRGFLLSYFYIVLAVGVLSMLLVIGSVSDAANEGSISPLIESLITASLLLGVTVWIAHSLSNRKKFPPMGKHVSGSNLEIYKRLRPANGEVHIDRSQLLELVEVNRKLRQRQELLRQEEGEDTAPSLQGPEAQE